MYLLKNILWLRTRALPVFIILCEPAHVLVLSRTKKWRYAICNAYPTYEAGNTFGEKKREPRFAIAA